MGCAHAAAKKLGDVVTLNLTMLRAGVTHNAGASYALNVVPSVAEAGFDLRIPPHGIQRRGEGEEMGCVMGWDGMCDVM